MPSPSLPDPHDLAAALRALIAANRAMADTIERLLPQPAPQLPAFIPTDFQRDILSALKNRSMRTDALAHRLQCGRSRLFADPGGLPELQEQGMVAHHRRVGYFRPDAPPPDLGGETET